MVEYNIGDLIEASRGREVHRAYASGGNSEDGVYLPYAGYVDALKIDGWAIRVIMAAPHLPTELETIIKWRHPKNGNVLVAIRYGTNAWWVSGAVGLKTDDDIVELVGTARFTLVDKGSTR